MPEPAEPGSDSHPPSGDSRFCTLIVDDDADLLGGLRTALRAEPYDLYTANDVNEALAIAQAARPNVVISDYHLPDRLGTEFLEQVREILPDSCRILMTGSPTLDMAISAINKGAVSRLFLKPFNIIVLAKAVREALEKAELAQLSLRLLARARSQQAIIDRVRREAPHLLEVPKRPPTGASMAEDYFPHDYAAILRVLRRGVTI